MGEGTGERRERKMRERGDGGRRDGWRGGDEEKGTGE